MPKPVLPRYDAAFKRHAAGKFFFSPSRRLPDSFIVHRSRLPTG